MLNAQKTEQPLPGTTSTENQTNSNSNSNKLIERVEIDRTPFTAIKQNEKWFLTWGFYVLTEKYDTLKEIKELLRTDMYNIIGPFLLALLQENQTREENKVKILNDRYKKAKKNEPDNIG